MGALAGALPDGDAAGSRRSRAASTRSPMLTAWTSSAATRRAVRSTLCVTIMGEVPAGARCCARGARGDDVYVSGVLGDAALAVGGDDRPHDARRRRARRGAGKARNAGAADRARPGAARRRHRRARRFRWTGRRSFAHSRAARPSARRVDLAGHPRSPVARAARRAVPSDRLAIECLLAGGDDYELCFTAPRAAARAHRADRSQHWRCRSRGSARSRGVPVSSSATSAACRMPGIAAGLRSFRVTCRRPPPMHNFNHRRCTRLRRAVDHAQAALSSAAGSSFAVRTAGASFASIRSTASAGSC